MMVVREGDSEEKDGKEGGGEGKEVEKDISLSVSSTVIQDFNI